MKLWFHSRYINNLLLLDLRPKFDNVNVEITSDEQFLFLIFLNSFYQIYNYKSFFSPSLIEL